MAEKIRLQQYDEGDCICYGIVNTSNNVPIFKMWFKDDLQHREDAPALVSSHGGGTWYFRGERVKSQKEYKERKESYVLSMRKKSARK